MHQKHVKESGEEHETFEEKDTHTTLIYFVE